MLCKFCQHEFDDSLTECPYCHKQVDFEPKSLTREERDNFAGTTIEMEGNPGEEGYTKRAEYQEKDSYYQQDDAYQRADKSNEDNSHGRRTADMDYLCPDCAGYHLFHSSCISVCRYYRCGGYHDYPLRAAIVSLIEILLFFLFLLVGRLSEWRFL